MSSHKKDIYVKYRIEREKILDAKSTPTKANLTVSDNFVCISDEKSGVCVLCDQSIN